MARKFDLKARKEGPDRARLDDGGPGPVSILDFDGNPLNGSASSDFLLARDAGTINGLGGSDLILGDIGIFRTATTDNTSFATANDLDSNTSIWSTDENPLVGNDSIPHATIYVLPVAGTTEYFRLVIGAGQTITIDTDGAYGSLGSATTITDTVIELYAASDLVNPIASDNDSSITEGGYGSADAHDSFLTFTNVGSSATYYIRIREFGGDGNFEADEDFLLNVTLTGHAVVAGPAQNGDTIDGGTGDDHLFGAGGSDFLFGGTGADLMHGGTGDDTFYVDDSGDRVWEAFGEGNDRVAASANFALLGDSEVERLEALNLSAVVPLDLTGSSIANTIYGNNGVNLLRGEGGNDSLFGFGGPDFLVGGTGSDLMAGGPGDDVYYIDDTSDAFSEAVGEGNDRIAASISLALAPDTDIERIEAVNLTSTVAMDLTGSDIANTILGNDGVNILRGQGGNDTLSSFGGNDFLVGGAGADAMIGGLGDDTYYVDDATDVAYEAGGEGNDRIAASVSYALSNGSAIERLEAVNATSTDALNLTGSDSGNTIIGNNGVNILRGEGQADFLFGYGGDDHLVGGTFSDAMFGGAGNDTYYVDNAVDSTIELAGEGFDRVATSVSYGLLSSTEIELLEADTQSSVNAMDLSGSNTANTIRGNDGANVLDGKGGNDILTGYGGADTFAFSTALGPANIDTITGFVSGSDKIRLDNAVFTELDDGLLPGGRFVIAAAAQDSSDRIIYNSATGQLFYDADGTGAIAQVQFATLSGAPALSVADFIVI